MTREEQLAAIAAYYQTDKPELANLYSKSNEVAIWLIKYCPDNPARARALKDLERLTSNAAASIINIEPVKADKPDSLSGALKVTIKEKDNG